MGAVRRAEARGRFGCDRRSPEGNSAWTSIAALAFVRPCDLVVEPAAPGDPAADCTVHAARHDGRTVHLLVSARGAILDGAPASGWASPRRGDPCKLRVHGARIFPSDDEATRAALAQREPAPSDTGLSLSGRGMHGEVGEAGA